MVDANEACSVRASCRKKRQPPTETPIARTPRALIVDDDALIGSIMGRMLRQLGLEYTHTMSPVSALGKLAKEEAYALLVADLRMPQMAGEDLVRIAADSQERLCVLFVSGYSMDHLQDYAVPGVTFDCLQKPFTLGQFEKTVRRLLSRCQATGLHDT